MDRFDKYPCLLQKIQPLGQCRRVDVSFSHQMTEPNGTRKQTVNDHQDPFFLKQKRTPNEGCSGIAALLTGFFLNLIDLLIHFYNMHFRFHLPAVHSEMSKRMANNKPIVPDTAYIML